MNYFLSDMSVNPESFFVCVFVLSFCFVCLFLVIVVFFGVGGGGGRGILLKRYFNFHLL